MARKRPPVDPDAGQRLLQSKLKILQGARTRRPNVALDILTGRAGIADDDNGASPDETLVPPDAQVHGAPPHPVAVQSAHPVIDDVAKAASPPPIAPVAGAPAPPLPETAVLDTATRAPSPGPRSRPQKPGLKARARSARTVYLSDEDVRDLDFIVRAWRRRTRIRMSRSEVLRQAVGHLRASVELGAGPRTAEPHSPSREESDSHG